ncbi:hypothetical protein SAMN05421741_10815 [Paenimyroides ummariense]|uniref:Uncharacterized protein n=2 Tax=Paenimyroides ummariense TaxID=913024 RepID=A0A1I5AEF2_9FLAO|nr:hypothetical protein SAMN05421741_10815 [Paenimyroides ummariense]
MNHITIMKYYTIHINDSGAIEDTDIKNIAGEKILICKMYDDPKFNNLNDILHSLKGYVLNEKALNIFKESNTIPFKISKAKVLRKEKVMGFIRKYKSYDFYELDLLDEKAEECYEWIDFEKSEVFAVESSQKKIKIRSHQETLDLIEINKSNPEKSYSFETLKIVFNKNFNSKIDLFKIPYYSWGIYVSEALKSKLESKNITDISFAENKEQIGKVWKPYFPKIEFD